MGIYGYMNEHHGRPPLNDSVQLLGLHPLKHALRFGAEITWAVTKDKKKLSQAAMRLAPDVSEWFETCVREIAEREFLALAPYAKDLEVIAEAKRPKRNVAVLLQKKRKGPAVVLERPRHLGNIGAVVRIGAAASASAILTTGEVDPWHPAALRGSAGLHFALPVISIGSVTEVPSPRIALHPEGRLIDKASLRPDAAYLFGSERRGLSEEALSTADDVVRLPMREGVSSLNLATSVAVVLYTWRIREL